MEDNRNMSGHEVPSHLTRIKLVFFCHKVEISHTSANLIDLVLHLQKHNAEYQL